MKDLTNKSLGIAFLAVAAFIVTSCSNKPKIIEAETSSDTSGIFEMSQAPNVNKIIVENEHTKERSEAFHEVIAREILPTEKYIYLKVSEGAQTYWLATKKMEVSIGDTYYYRNGLLKTNFESKEYARTFDKLYLVSSLVSKNHSQNPSLPKQDIEMHSAADQVGSTPDPDLDTFEASGTITIAQLVANKEDFEGKTIKIRGTCTKINAKIMGRNWIHLQDGSMDNFDLVVTSNSQVPVGHQINVRGTVSLKKDFGSGYYYDILIENGELLSSL